jgi:hypothetical protein
VANAEFNILALCRCTLNLFMCRASDLRGKELGFQCSSPHCISVTMLVILGAAVRMFSYLFPLRAVLLVRGEVGKSNRPVFELSAYEMIKYKQINRMLLLTRYYCIQNKNSFIYKTNPAVFLRNG